MESLLTDITGWTGVQLETWRLLGRTQHLLEPVPGRTTIFSDTPRGGWADLRSQRLPALAYTGFEELAHTPDFRRYDRGVRGRYNIPKVGAHLYRMRAFEVHHPTLHSLGSSYFTFDPSGRAVPLFQPADRPTPDQWEPLREWQMPKALSCRLFNHAEYEWTDTILTNIDPSLDPGPLTLLKKYSGWRIPSTLELRKFLTAVVGIDLDDIKNIMNASLVPECGPGKLYRSILDADDGNTHELTPLVPNFQMLVDDLAHLTNEELDARALPAFPKLALWLLRDARHAKRLLDNLPFWARRFRDVLQAPHGAEAMDKLVRYITLVNEHISWEDFRATIHRHAPEAEEATMTIAEQLIAQGEAKGLTLGVAKGQANLLRKQLTLKFGEVPSDYQTRLANATLVELDIWAERVLSAASLDEVFADSTQ